MATINDVAKRAGVSRSTVSLVINKSPLVKEKTRLLVESVIAEMNYVPNSNARGLSARVTNNIGVIFMQDYLSKPSPCPMTMTSISAFAPLTSATVLWQAWWARITV